MSDCCVLNCKNSAAKSFRLFSFPSGEHNCIRREVWLSLLNRPDFNANFRICEVHFSDNQLENGRQDGKRILRPCAVPDLLRSDLDCNENRRKRHCIEGDIITRLSDGETAGTSYRIQEVTNEATFQHENSADKELVVEMVHEYESIENLKQRLTADLQKLGSKSIAMRVLVKK